MKVYLVIDHNNIHVPAKKHNIDGSARKTPNGSLSVDYDRLIPLVLEGRSLEVGHAIGSSMGKKTIKKVTSELKKHKVVFQHKSANADDAILARLMELVMCNQDSNVQIILMTGDGNDNDGGVSFSNTMINALERNQNLRWEQWSWKSACHNIYKKNRPRYRLRYLDSHKFQFITGLSVPKPEVVLESVIEEPGSWHYYDGTHWFGWSGEKWMKYVNGSWETGELTSEGWWMYQMNNQWYLWNGENWTAYPVQYDTAVIVYQDTAIMCQYQSLVQAFQQMVCRPVRAAPASLKN